MKSPSLALTLQSLITPYHYSPDPSGCSKHHSTGYHDSSLYSTHNVLSGNLIRNYTIFVPSNYNEVRSEAHRFPLIMDFHGAGDTPDEQYNNSRYFNYTAGAQYLAIYPQGVDRHWQGPSYASPCVDDLQFVTDLLAHLKTEYCVDPNRIYASGKSNGGGFTDTLACSDNGDDFAAFAMASAALYTDIVRTNCPKKRAILESHGDNDTVIPYTGKKRHKHGGPLPDIVQWVRWWGERNECASMQQKTVNEYSVTSYSSCGNLTDLVQHYRVFGLGHCWPSSAGDNTDSDKSYCTDHALDYTPIVLNFFEKWDLGNGPKN